MSAYQDFLARGGKDADWEEYAANRNGLSLTNRRGQIMHSYLNGIEVSGNDIANLLRSASIAVEPAISGILQHDDTMISRESIAARGLSRKAARRIVDRVTELTLHLYPGHGCDYCEVQHDAD